jgi:hypothetical protein
VRALLAGCSRHASPGQPDAATADAGSGADLAPAAATVDPQRSTVTVTPAAVPADGVSVATIALRLVDSSGTPLAGRAVALGATGGGDLFMPDPPAGLTDADGRFTATLASTVAERKAVTATALDPPVALAARPVVAFTVAPPVVSGVAVAPASGCVPIVYSVA